MRDFIVHSLIFLLRNSEWIRRTIRLFLCFKNSVFTLSLKIVSGTVSQRCWFLRLTLHKFLVKNSTYCSLCSFWTSFSIWMFSTCFCCNFPLLKVLDDVMLLPRPILSPYWGLGGLVKANEPAWPFPWCFFTERSLILTSLSMHTSPRLYMLNYIILSSCAFLFISVVKPLASTRSLMPPVSFENYFFMLVGSGTCLIVALCLSASSYGLKLSSFILVFCALHEDGASW